MRIKLLAAASAVMFALPVNAIADDHDGGGPSDGGSSSFSDLFSTKTKTKVTSGQNSPDINQVQSEAYNGPKARVAVARFTDKTRSGWYRGSIGRGMADQLATALFNSNRFILLERQTLSDVLKEQNLGASGRVSRDSRARVGEIEGAELLVTGAVTEFQRAKSGSRGRISGGGIFGRVLGAVSGGMRKAHMAIDMRIIDTRTSRIVAATSVEGESTDVNIGAALSGALGGGRLGGSLSTWKNTPIEKALRATIVKAVQFIVSKTPRVYYRHGAPQVASTSRPAAPRAQAPGGSRQARLAAPAAKPVVAVPTYNSGSVVRVKANRLNVRGGPGSRHAVQYVALRDDPLLVMKQSGTWLQVQNQNGQPGWVASWLIYPDAAGKSIRRPAPAPVRTAVPAPPAPAPQRSAAPSGGDDPVMRLKRLKRLYDAELITEGEYRARRKKILDTL